MNTEEKSRTKSERRSTKEESKAGADDERPRRFACQSGAPWCQPSYTQFEGCTGVASEALFTPSDGPWSVFIRVDPRPAGPSLIIQPRINTDEQGGKKQNKK
jgi:hypothetical protein